MKQPAGGYDSHIGMYRKDVRMRGSMELFYALGF